MVRGVCWMGVPRGRVWWKSEVQYQTERTVKRLKAYDLRVSRRAAAKPSIRRANVGIGDGVGIDVLRS